MGTDTVQQIKDRLSIVDVVSQYVKLERAGQNMRARCPFHAERTPSFMVSPERGTYHCFGCGEGGDIFSFMQAIEGVDFKGALKILAERAGVPLVYSRGEKKDEKDRLFEAMEAAAIFYQSQLTDEAADYLKKRGLDARTIATFRIGWTGDGWSTLTDNLRTKKFTDREIVDAGLAKKGERGLMDKFRNRIMFPIADSAGRVVAFSGRTFGAKAHPDAPKYLNSPETALYHKSRILYGFDKAKQNIRKHNFAILVEGQMDLIMSHQAGWANTVAVSGTAFTPRHAMLLKRMSENLVIALDADEAGLKAAARAARAALQQGLNVKVVQLPKDLDPADLILKEGISAWRKCVREAKDIITFLLDVLEERSKAKDSFRRAVENAVLPFVADVLSPIAREQYLREISERLNVSMQAVAEALEKVPRVSEADVSYLSVEEIRLRSVDAGESKIDRAAIAYSILVWQKMLPTHSLDLDAYERELEEALGADEIKRFRALSEQEQERLRFEAERMYGRSVALRAEVRALLNILLRERLSRQLTEATQALKEAEKAGNDEEAAVHMSVCNVLTRRIARLHEVM